MSYKSLLGNKLLDLPELMERLGDGDYARSRAYCPFCGDRSKSFSVTKPRNAAHRWRCVKCLKEGGCLEYLMARNGLSKQQAPLAYAEISNAAGGLWVSRELRMGLRANPQHSQAAKSQEDSAD